MLLISMLVPLPLLGTTTRLSSHLQNPFRLMATREPMTAASLQGDDVAGRQKNRMKAIDCPLHEVPWMKTRAEGLQQNFQTTAALVEWGTLHIKVQDRAHETQRVAVCLKLQQLVVMQLLHPAVVPRQAKMGLVVRPPLRDRDSSPKEEIHRS